MQGVVKLQNHRLPKLQHHSRGYILITLMLFISLLTIAALAVLPEIVHQIQRDREEEMINRATGYRRAVQKYYKKFGRYPTRLEELESTNQSRFLRKRYQDPITRKDFRLVRMGDPALNMLGLGGAGLGPGLGQGPGQQSFVSSPTGGVRTAGANDANMPRVTGLPQQQSTGTPNPAGSDSENSETPVEAKAASSSSDSSPAPGGQVFGGGPILGVASVSKAKTIREFNKKNHYNDWLFIYDPSADRGGLLKGPVQPDLNKGMGIAPQQGMPQGAPNAGPQVPQPPQPGPPATQEPPEQ
jgi:type II secretory pathway pseudopilin PulG